MANIVSKSSEESDMESQGQTSSVATESQGEGGASEAPAKVTRKRRSGASKSPRESGATVASSERRKNARDRSRGHPIAMVLDTFLSAVDDFADAPVVVLPLIAKSRHRQLETLQSKLQRFESSGKDGRPRLVATGAHAATELLASVREAERLVKSKIIEVILRSLFIGVFSEYDAFVGALSKVIYERKPALFRGIRREIALSELLEFESIQAVMLGMLEREIDAFRRESYVEQFAALERNFGINNLREFSEWPQFVEMSQRRNLMTHNDGRVSRQYVVVCEREGFKFAQPPVIGQRLELDPAYLRDVLFVVRKVGFMLTHTLWRKLFPDDQDVANDALNQAIYELLLRRRWRSASEFGLFALQDVIARGMNDMTKRIVLINTAIALKYRDKGEEAVRMLDKEDWTASIREFKLANAVLREQYTEAAKIMRDIGKTGELIEQLSYHDWPLFNKFRGRREFQKAYADVYSIPFIQKVTQQARAKSAEISRTITEVDRSMARGERSKKMEAKQKRRSRDKTKKVR